MKKSLLALAVLTAVTGAAYAQSSVTLYGKVDLGMVMDSGAAAGKSVRLDSGVSGGSRIGFKGVEDLGGGMKAAFQLETGYCADSAAGAPNFCTGSNQFMGRQAYGALSGGFGSISAGRQYSLVFNNLATIDPFGAGFAGQADNVDLHGNYIVDPGNIRLNNSVTYNTPSTGGFTASAEIAFGEVTGNVNDGREAGGAVTYAAGPAYAGLVFSQTDNANGSGDAKRIWMLGGSYDFGLVKIHALAQKVDGDPTGLASIDYLSLMGGVTVPLAGGFLLGSYIDHNDHSNLNHDANQWGVAYQYPLSKRTSLYTAFARIEDRNGAAYLVGNATATGTGNKAINLGVVHNF